MKMKTSLTCSGLLVMLLASAPAAQAIALYGHVGENYTVVGTQINSWGPGLTLDANWANNDGNGQEASLMLGLNVPLGFLQITPGVRALYLDPSAGEEGYAAAPGMALQLAMGRHFTLYGEAWYAPDSLSSGVADYVSYEAGLRWHIIPLVSMDLGYRYIKLAGQDDDNDAVLADGGYLGASVHF